MGLRVAEVVMSAKGEARRLACYLGAIGIRPAITGLGYKRDVKELSVQYLTLSPELRREARSKGRRIVRNVGLALGYARMYPAIPPPAALTLEKRERALRVADLLDRSLGRCSRCKSRGRKKRSWPSREMAETFRLLVRDLSLEVYECAVHPGSYHLGHTKKPA